jgi:hypothetical protein
MGEDWYTQFVVPVLMALRQHDRDALGHALLDAHIAVTSRRFKSDHSRALALFLVYVRVGTLIYLGPEAELSRVYSDVLRELCAINPAGPVSERYKHAYYLQLRITGGMRGFRPLPRGEFRELVAGIMPQHRQTEQWHFITSYAFFIDDAETITAGYEAFLENHSPCNQEFIWRRLQIMHNWHFGQVRPLDIERLISSATSPGNVMEVQRLFFPRFRERGLMTGQLEEMLANQHELVSTHPLPQVARAAHQ